MSSDPDDSPAPRPSGSHDRRDPFQLPNPGLTDPSLQAGLWDGVDESAFDARRAELIEGYSEANRMKIAMADTRISPTARLVNAMLAASGWSGRISRGILAARLTLDPGNVSRALKEIEQKTGLRIFRRRQSDGHADFQFVFSGLDVMEIQTRRAERAQGPPSQNDIQAQKPPSHSDIQGEPPSHSDTEPPSQFDSEVALPPSHSDTRDVTMVTDLIDIDQHEYQSVSHLGDARASEKRPAWYVSLAAAYPDTPPLSDFLDAASLAGWDDRRVAAAGEKLLSTYIEPGTPVHAPLQLFKRIAAGLAPLSRWNAGQRPSGADGPGKYAADRERRRTGR